jgi:hypothetical protein
MATGTRPASRRREGSEPMTRTELLLTAATIAAGRWAWRACFHPFARCRGCQGSKTNPGSTRQRWGACKRCGGSGSRQVLGSKQVHRAIRAARWPKD